MPWWSLRPRQVRTPTLTGSITSARTRWSGLRSEPIPVTWWPASRTRTSANGSGRHRRTTGLVSRTTRSGPAGRSPWSFWSRSPGCGFRLQADLASGSAPVDGRDHGLGPDPVREALRNLEQRLDQGVREQVRLEAELDQAGVHDVVVVALLFDPRVR